MTEPTPYADPVRRSTCQAVVQEGCFASTICGHLIVWDKDFGWLHEDFHPQGWSFRHDAQYDGGEC